MTTANDASGETLALYHSDAYSLRDIVKPATVDAVISSPGRRNPNNVHLAWNSLRAFAVHALKPGGVFAALADPLDFPSIWDSLSADPYRLRYRWMGAVIPSQGWGRYGCSQIDGKVTPLLIFTRADDAPVTVASKWAEDLFVARGAEFDEEREEWTIREETFADVLKSFVPAGGLVADPFLGDGAIAEAAVKNGFRFMGSDKNEANVAAMKARLLDALGG